MDLRELENKIGLDEELVKELESYNFKEKTLEDLKKSYYEDFTRFKSTIRNEKEGPFLALKVYLELALNTYNEYMNRKIPEKIYVDSMKDIRIWANDYKKKHGVWGIDEHDWLAESLDLKVIRLGRLQYEKTRAKKNLGPIGEGEEFLAVHIPEDGKLDPKDVENSLDLAREFYKDQGIKYFYCKSWLLSLNLDRVLDENSNIVKFRDKFNHIEMNFDMHQPEERIFSKVLEDKSFYPEETSLQKNAKKAILEGLDIGVGSGYIKI
ncbi:acyltransferase domain-containing protein [Peptoniphilus duerdenii]|uniref:acyltransferase domain-containing protein n=1 Tax=Peptoniphilus duerdenii TaxID=507750 RepID=UPI0023F0531A|nr:acyltransferase domain-containing protein [Peptoniphilus duerdenii]